MERHDRRTQPLVLSEPLARLLSALRSVSRSEAPAELDIDHVRAVEATVGCRLPDPVLAILAAKLGPFVETFAIGLGEIPRHTRAAGEARARGDLIVFGVEPGEVFHGFLIGAEDSRISTYRRRGAQLSSVEDLEWLRQHSAIWCPEPPSAEPLAVRLVRAPKPEPEGPRVRHKKWGVGQLMTSEGSGERRKIKVAFPSVGLKVLNARFVEFLDEAE